MLDYLPFLLGFIIALCIGIYLGKLLSTSKNQSEKAILEEKLKVLDTQLQMQKEQFESEKKIFRNNCNSIMWRKKIFEQKKTV